MISSITKKLTLVAVASACGYASAATISHTVLSGNYSIEKASNSATTGALTLNNVSVTMGAFQSRDSVLQLQLSGARFVSGTVSSVSVTCTSNNLVLDVGSPSASSSTWDFGITGTSGSTSSAVCSFASLAILRSSMTSAGVVTISSGVKRTSDTAYTYDPSTTAAQVASTGSQIVSVAISTAFNGVVDYQSKQGYGFVTNDGTYGDILGITVTTRDTADSFTGALSVNFALSAEAGKSFAFLDAEACGVAGKTPILTTSRSTAAGYARATGLSATNDLTINSTCTTLTYVGTGTFNANAQINLELGHQSSTPSTGVVIEPMTFPSTTVTVSQGATSRGASSGTGAVTGSWTSNGATVVIPYMPINLSAGTSSIDPVITVANRSSLTGVLTGTMRDEDGNSCTLDNLGSIGATRTKNLGGLVKAAFAACSNLSQTSTERMYITITATLPDSTTTFFSGYTVGSSSRVSVVNSTNGK